MRLLVFLLLAIQIIYSNAYGEDTMASYKNEAKSHIGDMQGGSLADVPKSIKGYDSSPKETLLDVSELRIKADEKMKSGVDDKTEQDKIERQAIQGVKSSMNNPHKSEYTVEKMKEKDFIKNSVEILEDPIAQVNTKGGAGCKIVGEQLEKENTPFEEYWVDVEDSGIKPKRYKCEEDEDRLFECHRSIKSINCASRVACAFDNPKGEGGLYTDASNQEFASASGGMNWSYNGDILSFGADQDYIYGDARSRDETCYHKDFIAKFFIKDKEGLSEFRIIKIHENNLLNISVNGTMIRDGVGLGGGNCWHNAGRIVWDDVNYDLIPYLHEGWNEIHVHLAYTKGGHAAIKIRAKQYCCTSWNDDWESDCPVGG